MSQMSKPQRDLIGDLENQAKCQKVTENDLPAARYRATLVQATCIFKLLFGGGNCDPNRRISDEKARQVQELGDQILQHAQSNERTQVIDLTKRAAQLVKDLNIDQTDSDDARRFRRQEAAVKWMNRAEIPRGREMPVNGKKLDVKVLVRHPGDTALDETSKEGATTIEKQPDVFTTAVIIWNILKTPAMMANGLGPGLRLYEARDESKWFPAVHHSKPIRKLYRGEPDGKAFLFAVDEDSEYVVATLCHANNEDDRPVRLRGVVINLDDRPTRAAAKIAAPDASAVKVEYNSPYIWVPRRVVPQNRTLQSVMVPFSSDYFIIRYPKETAAADTEEPQHSTLGRIWRRFTGF